jgi:hypothetical protein
MHGQRWPFGVVAGRESGDPASKTLWQREQAGHGGHFLRHCLGGGILFPNGCRSVLSGVSVRSHLECGRNRLELRYRKNRSLIPTQLGCFVENNPGFVAAQARE